MTEAKRTPTGLRVQIRNLKPEDKGKLFTANRHLQVLVNDEPVTGLKAVNIKLEVGMMPLVTLTFAPGELEVDPVLLINTDTLRQDNDKDEPHPAG